MRWVPVLFAFLCLAPSARAQDEIAVPHVTVLGTATAKVVPDRMEWSLTIRSEGPGLEAIAAENARTVTAVTAFLDRSGIAEKEIQSSGMRFGENWTVENGRRVRDGYYASTRVSFTLSDLDRYEGLWTGLAGIAGVSVDGVSYDTSERIDLQERTREEAAAAAREKARALAGALDAAIGEPLIVEEIGDLGPLGPANRYMVEAAPPGGAEGTSLSPGTITIRSRVRATFRLLAGRY